ncbi:FIST signal transduction protein, partial [Pseudotabrizicola sp.]
MKISTVQSSATSAFKAISEIALRLDVERNGRPDFLALHFGVGSSANQLRAEAMAQFETAALHGGSSCLGIMTHEGVNIASGAGVGAFAIWDDEGSFGTGSADLGADAFDSAQRATAAALAAAGRPGEIPDLVWLTVAPGREEQVLDGIRAVIGHETPIVGGSAADNDVSGSWVQFGPLDNHSDGVVVSVLFPSTSISSAYQSGYAPTGDSGFVTRVDGRRLFEIDGQPAATVYHGWTQGAVPVATTVPEAILSSATLWPLGRVSRQIASVPFHLLAHPSVANPDGSLDLFADVELGDQLWQMQGSADSLVARAGRVARQARDDLSVPMAGALVV